MAHNKNNINTLKESASKNENSSASAPKFKAMLVKDLLRSFEKSNTSITESTQKSKANSSKITEPYQKMCYGYKPLNFEGSSTKSTFKSSEMTSNSVNKIVTQKSQKTETNKLDKSAKKDTCDNLTIPPHQSKSKSFLNLYNAKSVSSKKQNLNINTAPCNCANRIQQFSHNSVPKSDVTNTVGIIQNIVTQLKTFLEQSVQVHEDQASKLKQILDSVKVISNAININESNNDFPACDRKDNPEVVTSIKDSLKTNLNINTLNHSSPVAEINKGSSEKNKKARRTEITQSVPLVKLVSNDESNDLDKKARQLPVDHLDSLSKAVSENQINCIITNARTPKSQKHRTIAEKSCRRRSLSMPSESDLDITEGSFTMLEKKLNIFHKKVPTKSSLVSSMNVSPSTPSFATRWDKRSKQPLKEYMALKMNSAFLVTPDVNWFQSRLESAIAGDRVEIS